MLIPNSLTLRFILMKWSLQWTQIFTHNSSLQLFSVWNEFSVWMMQLNFNVIQKKNTLPNYIQNKWKTSLGTSGIQKSNAQSCATQFPSEPLCKYCRVTINTRDSTEDLLRFWIIYCYVYYFHTLRELIRTKNASKYFILVAIVITTNKKTAVN